jgi:anti-sigma regulatory factor (Ser/Thr protein kinase)
MAMHTLQLRIPSDPRHARTARDAVVGFGTLYGVPQADLESMVVAVGEALANAIEHAETNDDIEIACTIDHEHIVATITDSGRGTAYIPDGEISLPSTLSEGGRGLPIMQLCTDIFYVKTLPGRGTAVTLGRFCKTSA